MKNEIFFHVTKDGITNKKLLRQAFECLKLGRHKLTLETSNNRSNQQNRFYWGGVIPLIKEGLKEAGYREITTNEETHELMKFMFLKKNIVNENTGEVLQTIGSTTKLTPEEFGEYIDKIAQFAAEFLGVTVPPPNTQVSMFASYDYDLKATIIE